MKIVETKEEILPELDEEFVKLVGEGYESVEALTTKIREDLVKAATEERDNKLHDQILNEMVERATIEYAPVMLESEVDRMLHEQARRASVPGPVP